MGRLAKLAMPAIALCLVACSSATGGQPLPRPQPSETTGPSLPHSGAPKVTEPLAQNSLREAEQNPCGTLSPEQVDELGLAPQGRRINGEAGPMCRWRNAESGSSASVYFPTEVIYEGLSQLYESHKESGGDDIFYPMQAVGGFPVLASSTGDQRDIGICDVQVGLTDQMVVYVNVRLSDTKVGLLKPCEKARDVAEMVVTTMKSGS